MQLMKTFTLVTLVSVAALSAGRFDRTESGIDLEALKERVTQNRFQRFNHACSPFKEIVLDEAQRDELKTLKGDLKEAIADVKAETTAPIYAATVTGVFDADAFASQAAANQALIIDLRAEQAEAMFNVLTAEQQATFVANLDNIENNESCHLTAE